MRRVLTVAVLLAVSCISGSSRLWAGDGTIAETEAYYLHSLSGLGGARKMVATNDRKTVVVFYTQSNSRLVYKATTDLGDTWPERPAVVGASLAGGIAAWIDEQDNIYLAYCDQRNTFCFRKLTFKGDATWELGEPGNGGKSLAEFRGYYHSGICKEPGKDGPIWACWWEHGKDGDKTGTVKRLRVSHSTDPDGKDPWSAPVDPMPANVALNENEGNTVTMLLAGGKPAVFVYQPATYGFKSGLCIYDGKEWSWHEVDTKPTPKTTVFPQAGYAVAADAKGVVHFVWNAQAETGSIFYSRFEDGKWSPVETLSSLSLRPLPHDHRERERQSDGALVPPRQGGRAQGGEGRRAQGQLQHRLQEVRRREVGRRREHGRHRPRR